MKLNAICSIEKLKFDIYGSFFSLESLQKTDRESNEDSIVEEFEIFNLENEMLNLFMSMQTN